MPCVPSRRASLGTLLYGALAALMLTEGSVLSPDRQALALPRGTGFAVIGKDGRTVLERSGEENYGWQVPDRAWSPSGRFLMVWRSDERGVHKIPIVDYTTARERVTLVPYSKTGTPLARPELYCVEPASGRVLRMPFTLRSWLVAGLLASLYLAPPVATAILPQQAAAIGWAKNL